MLLAERDPDAGGDHRAERVRERDEPGRERATARPLLQVDRQQEEEGGDPAEEGEGGEEPAAEGPVAQEVRVEDRLPTARGEPLFDRHEDPEQHDAAREEAPAPARPAPRLPLDDRQEDEHERRGEKHDAEHVEPRPRACPRLGQHAPPDEQRDEADGDVDEEDHPPAEPEEVCGDEEPAEERPGDRGQALDAAVRAECLAHLLRGQRRADDPEDLRHHEPRRETLGDPHRDEHSRARGERARGGGEDEGGEAGEEDAAAPVFVAEPAARDERGPEGERVGGDHPLELRRRGAEGALDVRCRDGDDRHVEQIHE